jgi:hypothetical protein
MPMSSMPSPMAISKSQPTLPCLYCGKTYHSAAQLARHLDTRHQGWVQTILGKLGVEVPEVYPIPEYRTAIAQAFATAGPGAQC